MSSSTTTTTTITTIVIIFIITIRLVGMLFQSHLYGYSSPESSLAGLDPYPSNRVGLPVLTVNESFPFTRVGCVRHVHVREL